MTFLPIPGLYDKFSASRYALTLLWGLASLGRLRRVGDAARRSRQRRQAATATAERNAHTHRQYSSRQRLARRRDADGDGAAEMQMPFIQGLNSPFGMALVGDRLYVANTDALLRFPYREGATEITEPGRKVIDLPAGPINQHWTRNVIASPDGQRLYVAVGSNSNIGENGMDQEIAVTLCQYLSFIGL